MVSMNDRLLVMAKLIAEVAKRHEALIKKRCEPRYSLGVEAEIYAMTADGHTRLIAKAWVNDISYQGIGFLTNTEMLTGKVLAIDLHRAAGFPLMVPVRIVHSRLLIPNVYRSGGLLILENCGTMAGNIAPPAQAPAPKPPPPAPAPAPAPAAPIKSKF